jgi:hypothetical protein
MAVALGRPVRGRRPEMPARSVGARRLLASRWRVPVVFSLLAAGAVLAAPAVASAPPLLSPVTGHVYLDDNSAGSNTIAVFGRRADGSLIPLPGSPFAAGGAGTGAGLASEGAVQIADGGRWHVQQRSPAAHRRPRDPRAMTHPRGGSVSEDQGLPAAHNSEIGLTASFAFDGAR